MEKSLEDRYNFVMYAIECLPDSIYLQHDKIINFYELFPNYLDRVIHCKGSINFIIANTLDDVERWLIEIETYLIENNLIADEGVK